MGTTPEDDDVIQPEESGMQYLQLPSNGTGKKERLAYYFQTKRNRSSASTQANVNHSTDQPPQPLLHLSVLFLNGFRSSMEGTKAKALEEFCLSSTLPHVDSFTRFDYRGHGKSTTRTHQCHADHDTDDDATTSNLHDDGNCNSYKEEEDAYFHTLGLTDWIEDARQVMLHAFGNSDDTHKIILIGSSMGAWIAFHLALRYPDRIAGILGIAAAPDFTRDVYQRIWSNPQELEELHTMGRVLIPSQYGDGPYPISQHLLEDGEQWCLLNTNNSDKDDNPGVVSNHAFSDTDANENSCSTSKNAGEKSVIHLACPVRLIHGQQDVDIPYTKALDLADAIAHDNVVVTLIKSGNHRLSTPKDLDIACRALEELVRDITASTITRASTTAAENSK